MTVVARRRRLGGVPLIVVALFIVDGLVVLAHAINFTLIAAVDRPRRMFDLANEANLPAWYSSMQLALLGLLAVLLAYARRRPRVVGWWSMLGICVLPFYLSVDEFVQLHELIGRALPSDVFTVTGLWMFIAVPALVVTLVLLYVPSTRFWSGPPKARTRVVLGLAIYLASAAGLEVASNFVTAGGIASHVQLIAEEGGELVGATVMVWGIVDLLAASNVRLTVSAPERSGGRRFDTR